MTNNKNFIVERKGCIAIIKIDNPPQNYLKDPAFISREELKTLEEDPDIKGIIITGVGRHFSAGADLNNLFKHSHDQAGLIEYMTKGTGLLEFISELNVPIVAAINSTCWGGGLEIAMSCHIRLASEKSLFAFPEINYNLMPGLGGIVRLVERAGAANSISLLMSGDIFDAEKALKYKIIHQLTNNNVLDYATDYINKLVESKPKKVITSIMQAINNAHKLPLHEAIHQETRLFCELAIEEAARRK